MGLEYKRHYTPILTAALHALTPLPIQPLSTPSQNELTPIMFNMELTHLGLEATTYQYEFLKVFSKVRKKF